MRILIVDDDEVLAGTVAIGLRRAQMAVDIALDGPGGLDRALCNGYDVIVLDRDLPGMHGDEIVGALVDAGCRSRVLMLTAAATTEDLVEGLNLGADDYLPKPFDFPALVARIRALGRRAHPAVPPVLSHGDLVVDTARRTASRSGRRLALAPKEFGILEILLAAKGRAVSTEELARPGMGRGRRPLHQRGQDRGEPAAYKARRTTTDRDWGQARLPNLRSPWRQNGG